MSEKLKRRQNVLRQSIRRQNVGTKSFWRQNEGHSAYKSERLSLKRGENRLHQKSRAYRNIYRRQSHPKLCIFLMTVIKT